MSIVEQIFIAPVGGSQMQDVTEIEAVQGKGLVGDRYAERTGYWSGSDECQVTLIEAEGLDEVLTNTQVEVSRGEHRRNIVTRGVDIHALAGKRFRVGEALLEYDRPRPPCRYIQSVSERGMTKALGAGRGGICARVVASGIIRAGDAIEIVTSLSQARH